MSKFQLHVSGLNLLSKCGISFERRYINNEHTPPSIAAATGTAVDRSVTHDLQQKIDVGELLPDEQVKAIARDTLVDEWARGVEASEEDTDEGLEASRDKTIDRAVKLAAFHHEQLAPVLKPTHVQRMWTLDIDGLRVQLAGTIDIQEGLDYVDDTKTSAKSPLKTLADTSLQLTTYALAIKAHDGQPPKHVRLNYLVMTPKKGDLKLVQLESVRTNVDFQPLLERVAQAEKQIGAGIFTPAPMDAWWCSSKFCPFHKTCRFAARPVSVAMTAA